MQNEWWMRPALQVSEAVLLPALPRVSSGMPRFSHRFAHVRMPDEPFVPVTESWPTQETALSTYVRPRGSMAGRGVLRAAGVSVNPFTSRPSYARKTARLRPRLR